MRFELIDAEKARFPVSVLCDVLEVSRSGFYAWKQRPPSAHAIADAQLAVHVVAAHHVGQKTYGSPRVLRELHAQGIRVARKRVARLMREQHIRVRQKRRYRVTTDSNHELPVAPNLLKRKFDVDAPNRVWVGDVTCIHTHDGWLFLAVIVDLYSRRVVGWATSESNDAELAKRALESALALRKPGPGLIHHSDRGSPYASHEYRRVLAEHGILASMSRKGDCWDNAVAESFFATLKAELVDHERYTTHDAATASIANYIDGFYNPTRRHSHLGYVSPIEFELKNQVVRRAA